jgi:glycosyltransferase involved in cell wall biosynthesis
MFQKLVGNKPVMKEDILPMISVLIPVHNEERHIERKIQNLLESDYPCDRMEIIVGCDGSTDASLAIIERLAETGAIRYRVSPERIGKPAMLNELAREAGGEIFVFNGIIYVVGVSILFKEKTKFTAISTVIAMAANILFNFLLIPPWGIAGAAYSTLISYFVRAVLIYYFSQRLFRIEYKWKKIIHVMVIYLALLAGSLVLNINNVLISLLINILLVLVFALVIYFLGIFNEREKQFIKSLLRHPLGIKAILSD